MTAKWCKHCRKHVALAGASDRSAQIRSDCPECGQRLSKSPPAEPDEAPSEFAWAEDPAMPPAMSRLQVSPFSFDSWELDQDLQDAQRLIAGAQRQQQQRAEQAAEKKQQAQSARDASKKRLPAYLRPDFAEIQSLANGSAGYPYDSLATVGISEKTDSFAAWCSRALGWMMITFGVALTAAGWVLQRGDLASLGLPAAILGVGGVIAGRLLRPKPRRTAPAPVMNPYYLPPSIGPWTPHGYLTQAFFSAGHGANAGYPQPPASEAADSQRMLREMKAQIEQLASRLDKS